MWGAECERHCVAWHVLRRLQVLPPQLRITWHVVPMKSAEQCQPPYSGVSVYVGVCVCARCVPA